MSPSTPAIHTANHTVRDTGLRPGDVIDAIGGQRPTVEIVEVGTRDGLQIERAFVPTERKIAIVDCLIDAGISQIEITSFVSPRAVPQLADAEAVIDGVTRRDDTYLMALVPNLRAAERANTTSIDAGVVLCSASETHNRKNLNRSIDESVAGFAAVFEKLQQGGKDVIGAVAVAFGCPVEGEVEIERLGNIIATQLALGAKHITLGDTTGMATPTNIRRVVRYLKARFPDIDLCLHLHNTRGIGLANVIVGLEEGVRRFDSSIGGLGGCPFAAGATGNICTEDLLYLLNESGYDAGVDLPRLIDTAFLMQKTLGRQLPGQVMKAGPRLFLHDAGDVATAAG